MVSSILYVIDPVGSAGVSTITQYKLPRINDPAKPGTNVYYAGYHSKSLADLFLRF